jgi:ATP-dependent HslUV protease ATP-binding subunit HslU
MENQLTPSQIVAELDKYIIGQNAAKRAVAIALRNRWRRLQVSSELQKDITPANILMIGSTGVGKTEIARRLAQLTEAPFIKVEASKYTEVGYVGRDVESMVRDLVEQSLNLTRKLYHERVKGPAHQAALEEVLDLLLPPPPGYNKEDPSAADASYPNTREKLKTKLEAGELNHRKVEVEITVADRNVEILSNAPNEQMEGIAEMLQGMIPKKKKTTSMTVPEALAYFTEEQQDRLIDKDALKREALQKAEQTGIIFIDEIDKIATKGTQGAEVSRQGVQRDLLPIVEGSAVNTKYGIVHTDHVLFIAAGAFHVARPSDLIPELQGRFPIRVELNSLSKEDFYRILTEPQNSLTRQYQALLSAEGVKLTFSDDALNALADIAFRVNQEVENIGARRLHTLLSNLLEDILFNVPDLDPTVEHVLTAKDVQQKLAHLAQDKDLSRYIL